MLINEEILKKEFSQIKYSLLVFTQNNGVIPLYNNTLISIERKCFKIKPLGDNEYFSIPYDKIKKLEHTNYPDEEEYILRMTFSNLKDIFFSETIKNYLYQ